MTEFPARLWIASIGFLVLATMLFAYAPTSADEDLWGHVRFGQDLLRTHEIVRPDIYSYTASNSPWVNHEWLAEAAFAWVYEHAGAPGLIGVKVAIAMFAGAVGYLYLTTHGLNPVSAGLWLIVAEHLMLPGFGRMRPQIFTCLFLSGSLVALDSAERGRTRLLWLLPPMFALWANLHGGVLAGAGILLLWVAGHAVMRVGASRMRASRPEATGFNPLRHDVLLPLGLALAATLVNPYGVRLWWFLRTALIPRPDIAEWTPLPMASLGGIVYLLLAALGVAGILLGTRPKSPGLVAVFFVLLLLPLLAVRHTPLFGIGALFIAGPHVTDTLAQRTGWSLPLPVQLTMPRKWMMGVFLAASGVLAAGSVPAFGCISIDGPFPVEAVSRLRRAGATGNMLVHFDWGEYVLWHLGPQVKVSVDGRRETLYERGIYAANMRFIDGTGDWDTLVRDPAATMVLASKRFPSFNLMRLMPGWALVYEDAGGGLFARDGSDVLRQLKAAPNPEPRIANPESRSANSVCFP